jgi:hypothetical protein
MHEELIVDNFSGGGGASAGMDALQVLRLQISMGLMEVRPDGTIWKLANRDNMQRVSLITPKRAERKSKCGYLMVKMEWHGKQYLLSAHVGSWEILVGKIPPKMDINHKDGVKINNHPENMEIVTRSDNLLHAYSTGLKVTVNVAKELSTEAKRLRSQGNSFAMIAGVLGVSQTTAFRAVNFASVSPYPAAALVRVNFQEQSIGEQHDLAGQKVAA